MREPLLSVESKLKMNLSFPPDGPEFAVWNHLESGWALADMELNKLGPAERRFVQEVAKALVQTRTELLLSPDRQSALPVLAEVLQHPRVRHAADLQLARIGIHRASRALERYLDLAPVIGTYRFTEKPLQYLNEVVQTYIFGFDAACIALAGATFERALHEVLVTYGLIQAPQSDDDRTPSVSKLIAIAERSNPQILPEKDPSVKRLVELRDRIMHRHMWDAKIIRQVALGCIEDLSAVLTSFPQAPS